MQTFLRCRNLWLVLAIATTAIGAEKPNVLFIAIDDLRPELGCYGSRAAISPNIDRLATRGVRFDNAHCQLAVCNPSRVSLLTGLRPDSTHVLTLDVRFRETIPDAVTLPQHFKKNGYTALGYGKIFHNPWPDNVSWSEPHSWPKKSELWSEEAKEDLNKFKEKLRSEGAAEEKIDRLRATATERVDVDDDLHIDGAIAVQTLEAMERLAKQKKPFFLAAGFVRPHLPFVVPKKYWDLYDREKIELANEPSLPADSPPFAMNTMYELRDYFDYLETPDPKSGSLTEAQQRELKHGYLASVSFIDAQVGRLLDKLDELGLGENTIVVLWSDHGWKLGEHNSWCKQTNYEIDTRVPLIIYDPRASGNGDPADSMVELVDVFPTLCDLAGLPFPKRLEGTSLKPALEKPNTIVKKAAISQFPRKHENRELMGYAYRTKKWRYIEWIDRQSGEPVDWELYNHSKDHSESQNIAKAPQNASVLKELGAALRNTLPLPLGAKPTPRKPRPTLSFHNDTSRELTLFWLPENRDPREARKIQPGETITQRTTIGHRFKVEGFEEIHTVSEQEATIHLSDSERNKPSAKAPNIVVIMGDDWSWPHASILGDKTVQTPNFDRIAREGILFENAFVTAPSCTPSRFAVATGQYHWRLGEGANLGGSLAKDVPVYSDLLSAAGFRTGFCRKGASPSQHTYRGTDPFGERYKNFGDFFEQQPRDQPFCFWYGAGEPHRPYDWQASVTSNLDLASIEVPPYLPDNDTTRTDLGDYYLKIQKLDSLAGEILEKLEASGELENTLIVMTGDNGMPFPRAKATLYDSGTRVPLAIRWGAKVKAGRTVTDFISLMDLAPTFLEVCGLPIPESMTGRSLLPILRSEKSGSIEEDRDHVLSGMERHVYLCPSRAIRTEDFLYIRNFSPEDWPTGETKGEPRTFDFQKTPWPTAKGAFSYNMDPGPTKQWMRLNSSPQDEQAFGRRPIEELYDLWKDPHQLVNLLAKNDVPDAVEEERRILASRMAKGLGTSGDPRYSHPNHATFEVRGWTIHLHDELIADSPGPTNRMLELLHGQLQRVAEAVPESALVEIRQIPIWINPPYEGKRGTAEYHPGARWLTDNGRDPAMEKAVEITNVNNFPFENRRMPYLLLHELAHGYHDRILQGGYGNVEVRSAFERARDAGDYDEVARFDGNKMVKGKAYGMTNPMEYFAESSEAYFGKNDFFPFDREELNRHDPTIHDLVEKLWNSPHH